VHKQVVIAVCEEPVFVIGAPRSGTSVLAWSLAHHHDFWTSPETDFLYWLFGRGRLDEALAQIGGRADGGWLARLELERCDLVAAIGLGLNAMISSKSEGRRWVDQSPTYTLVAEELSELFPGARFLHILRDGRSVVNSMVTSGFSTSWASDFVDACETWAVFVGNASRFRDGHADRCLTVPYSRLVAEPDAMFGEILEFVQAPQEHGPAEFFTSNRINSSYQADGHPAQYTGPSRPWEEWTDEQWSVFAEVAGPAMTEHGFPFELPAGRARSESR
jgi:hypothetical protein